MVWGVVGWMGEGGGEWQRSVEYGCNDSLTNYKPNVVFPCSSHFHFLKQPHILITFASAKLLKCGNTLIFHFR